MRHGLGSTQRIHAKLTCLFTGYTQALRPGVKASFGLALDTQRLNETTPSGPAHKVSDLLNLKFVGPILIERYL